ncbi:hypothetical protein DL96DRAFT_1687959 [Flagelloscypha sp. PMI_526]|nr:hypothetical protein DL96DRAFT_1687959 [Flagelloscypha sp. PMI_526]
MFDSEITAGSSAGANAMTTGVVIACDVLLTSGFFVSTAGLLTAGLSKRVLRSSQWFIFMAFASWWSIQYLLLVGNQLTGDSPPHALCLVQSASVYAAAPGTAFALLALFHQLIAIPFMIYIGVFVMGITLGILHPAQVVRDELRVSCHMFGTVMEIVEAGAVLLACIGIFILEGLIIVKIWKNLRRIRNFNRTSVTRHFSLSLVIRASAFSLLPIAAIIVSAVSMVRSSKDERTSTPAVNIFLSSIPLFAGLLFGTQKDIIEIWAVWKTPTTPWFRNKERLPDGKV